MQPCDMCQPRLLWDSHVVKWTSCGPQPVLWHVYYPWFAAENSSFPCGGLWSSSCLIGSWSLQSCLTDISVVLVAYKGIVTISGCYTLGLSKWMFVCTSLCPLVSINVLVTKQCHANPLSEAHPYYWIISSIDQAASITPDWCRA